MYTVGIDISKERLDWAALDGAHGALVAEGHQPNTAAGIAPLVTRLHALTPALIVLEATGAYHVPLLTALVAWELPVTLVNPAQVKAFRQTQLGRTKTDRQDARLLARFGATYAAELRRYTPPSATQAKLAAWVSYRDSLVAEQTRLHGQREAAGWQGEAQVQTWLAEQLAVLKHHLAAVDRAIAELLATLPEAAVLLAMTGVGPRVAAAVLGYLPVGLWGQAKAAAAYAGVHPHLEQSGRRQRSWLRKAGHARLRRYLYMAAAVAIRRDEDCAAFYQRLVRRGKPKQVAVCAVMHKLLRRMMGRLRAFAAQPRPASP